MVQSRKLRITFQVLYCALAVLGFAAQLGLFQGVLNQSYLVFYTNLSNLLCMLFMFASLARSLSAKETGDFAPRLKFVSMIMILVTFILYNVLLANYPSIFAYFASLKNGLNHCVLPILFVLDWFMFYERGKARWTWPLLSIFPPFLYVIYILIRAKILEITGRRAAVIYPYFFLNLDNLGWAGFLRWMAILLVAFLILGYVLCLLDQWLGKRRIDT